MNTRPAYYIGTHPDSFRRGQPARVLKVEYIKSKGGRDWRPCFKVKYPDGMIDWSPVGDTANYTLTDNPSR